MLRIAFTVRTDKISIEGENRRLPHCQTDGVSMKIGTINLQEIINLNESRSASATRVPAVPAAAISINRTAATANLKCACHIICWIKRSVGGAKDQFVRNHKHCSAASYAWLWNLLEHSMLPVLAKLRFKLPTCAHLLLVEC